MSSSVDRSLRGPASLRTRIGHAKFKSAIRRNSGLQGDPRLPSTGPTRAQRGGIRPGLGSVVLVCGARDRPAQLRLCTAASIAKFVAVLLSCLSGLQPSLLPGLFTMRRFAACFLLAMCAIAPAMAYDYPYTDPYKATVLGTPDDVKADVPAKIPLKIRKLPQYEGRQIPDALWYGARLDYSYAKQKGPAPLIFVIAGTGASHDSDKNQFLMRAFYAAGFHVVGITSPTYPTFVIAASATMVPGEQRKDAADIYTVMEKIWAEIGPKMEVTSFNLTGYSLGGTNAAFVSLLDEERKVFNFRKVLLVNPSVQIYNSISKLDRFLENIPGGLDNFNKMFNRVVSQVSSAYKKSTTVSFSPELVFEAFKDNPPRDEELAALIGISFRLSSSALIFTSDVMTNYGFIKPANVVLTRNTKLFDYTQVSLRVGFTDYFHEYAWPYYQPTATVKTRAEFAQLQGLPSIQDYLISARKIGVVDNQDDVILVPGEIEFLTNTFDTRAKIYPYGGHLGNLEQRETAAYIVDYFKQ
jgi:pimeloyl-ACP methyl ester carboxylesterase